jgi:hypothetical protein
MSIFSERVTNFPVMVGPVPLFAVQSMVLTDGYKIERVYGSRWSQALMPTAKTIQIEATLAGRERLLLKHFLEDAAAPLLAVAGIPVVSGMTVATDMQITDLKFTHSVTKREALDASITLVHVSRTAIGDLVGEGLDLALAVATAALPTPGPPNPVTRTPEEAGP